MSSRDPDQTTANDSEAWIGRFRVQACLGQGGMGAVYQAFDSRLMREVALKVLRPELLGSDAARARFQREALAASRLDHPGLCPVYEIGDADGRPYFVMPLLDGETLAARITRESSDDSALGDRHRITAMVEIVEKVAHALHHAHRAGLIHRDVKPGNILIKTDGEPVVLDFGLVRDASSHDAGPTGSNQPPGTPLYMAPEQLFRSATELGSRTDVYSLGVTLYEGLTLVPPFSGRSLLDLFEQIRSQPTPNPKTRNHAVSRDLQVVVAVATEKDPNRRYASCADLADDLRRLRRGEPIRARPISLAARCTRWLRSNPAAAAAIATLSIGLGVTTGMWAENAGLSIELSDVAGSATQQRIEAERLRQLAADRLERFDLLAIHARLTATSRDATALHPTWPNQAAPLAEWLDRVDAEFRPQLARVEDAITWLRGLATNPDQATPGAAEEPHPWAAEKELLAQKRDALRAAALVRSGEHAFQPPTLPSFATAMTKGTLESLGTRAMMLCGPDRPLGFYGQEGIQLALINRALESGIGPRYPLLALQAWGLLSNGLDQRARRAMQAAVELAPVDQRADFEWELRRLDRARREAAAELETTDAICRELERFLQAPRDLQFAEPADRVLYEALLRIRRELYDLVRPGGQFSRVEQSWRWSAALAQLSEHHPRAGTSWAEAAAAVAKADGVVASELYARMPIALTPQAGLVPIGMNPVTRLWEFYHLRSAVQRPDPDAARQLEIPRHRPDGSIEVRPETGIVFVLIPGGMTTIGSQDRDPKEVNYDRDRQSDEPRMTGPVKPYFLARHEMTQGQWARLAGSSDSLSRRFPNQSLHCAGMIWMGRWFSLSHPVENVSWSECDALLRRHGLRLPSEWQWEHACRGGQSLPYSSGPGPASLELHANVLDAATSAFPTLRGQRVGFDDGYVVHAPVGSFRANPFGLFDVHGNVLEWCNDRISASSDMRAMRGGSFKRSAREARSAARLGSRSSSRDDGTGLRACRALH